MKDIMLAAFILSAPATSTAGTEGDCYHAIAEASYKESGIEDTVNVYFQRQLKHIPKDVQIVVGNSFILGKMIQERKASYTWTF